MFNKTAEDAPTFSIGGAKRPPLARVDFPVSGENVCEADNRGAGPAGLDFCAAKRLGERNDYPSDRNHRFRSAPLKVNWPKAKRGWPGPDKRSRWRMEVEELAVGASPHPTFMLHLENFYVLSGVRL